MITGKSRVYIMIGHPVAQVKSPEIFNRWFERHGVDAVMVPMEILPGGVSLFVECLRQTRNVDGVVVTMPYKETIAPLVDLPGSRVKALGAANVLRCSEDGLIEADMTDGRGFLGELRRKGGTVPRKHLFVIGYGGAGGAVAWDAPEAGAAEISLMDIDGRRAARLGERLIRDFPERSVAVVQAPPEHFDVVFNGSPLGMAGSDPLPMDPVRIPDGAVVCDAVTSPAMTPFLARARERGLAVQTGPEMAEAQAPAIAAFFGLMDFGIPS